MRTKKCGFMRACALILSFVISISMLPALKSEAASSERERFKQELIQMLYTIDESTHDVSRYKLSEEEADYIFRR